MGAGNTIAYHGKNRERRVGEKQGRQSQLGKERARWADAEKQPSRKAQKDLILSERVAQAVSKINLRTSVFKRPDF